MTPKANHASPLGAVRFALPKLQFSAGGGVNLNDFVKQRMKQETQSLSSDKPLGSEATRDEAVEKENNVPKLVASPAASKATSLAQFAALSIGQSSSTASPTVPMKSFTNLSDLAKHHLGTQGTSPTFSANASQKFSVPQLFKKPFACASPSSALSGSDDTSSQQMLTQTGWILDLKSALIKQKPDAKHSALGEKSLTKHKGASDSVDPIKYGFIDCDITETVKPTIDEFCTIDASSVLQMDLSNHRTLTSSAMGIVLGIRYRKRKLPVRVSHHFPTYTTVEPFRFDSPSPDDIVLGHIKKFRN
uniref:Uncharacterized protein n=1 Tax=Anopheles funestus TaxID=62324 RepID=A0A4Y0BG12_ANOFN